MHVCTVDYSCVQISLAIVYFRTLYNISHSALTMCKQDIFFILSSIKFAFELSTTFLCVSFVVSDKARSRGWRGRLLCRIGLWWTGWPHQAPLTQVQDDKDVEQGHTHAKSRSCSDYIIYTSLAQCTVPVLGCLWNLMLMINFFLVDEYSPPPTQTIFLLAF